MSFSKALVLVLSLVASSSALATPYLARNPLHHRALAHRAPVPIAAPAPLSVPVAPIRKRANGKRCKQRSSSAPVSSSVTPATSAAVVNAAPDPATVTPKTTPVQEQPTTTPKTTTPQTTAAPPTQAATTTPKAVPTTTTAPPSTGSEPSYMTGTQTGQGTFYATGLGACGITNTDTDYIAAVSHLLFDTFPNYNRVNPNSNPVCNRKVKATYQGKSVTVAITDRCTGCAITDLDFSPSAFNQLADFSVGRISGMQWNWV